MNYTLKNEYYTVTVSDMGAEIISIKSPSGYEFLWQGADGLWSMQAPLLFPLCGSFANRRYTILGEERPIGLHGFALRSLFELVSKTDDSIELRLTANEATREEFPFEFTLTARYTLRGDSILFEASVKNDSHITMPYMFGWHPGFNLPTDNGQDTNDYEITLGVDSLSWTPMINDTFNTTLSREYALSGGTYRLNTDEIYPNDTMIFKGHKNFAKMSAPNHSYELSMEWSENLTTLCLWKEPVDDAKFICVEPWSDYNMDGINDSNFDKRRVERLAPGKTDNYFINLKIKE